MVPVADANFAIVFWISYCLMDLISTSYFCGGKQQCIELENWLSKEAESVALEEADHLTSGSYSNRLAECELSICLVSNFRPMLN